MANGGFEECGACAVVAVVVGMFGVGGLEIKITALVRRRLYKCIALRFAIVLGGVYANAALYHLSL